MARIVGTSVGFGIPEGDYMSKITGVPAGIKWRARFRHDEFAVIYLKFPDSFTKHYLVLRDGYYWPGWVIASNIKGTGDTPPLELYSFESRRVIERGKND